MFVWFGVLGLVCGVCVFVCACGLVTWDVGGYCMLEFRLCRLWLFYYVGFVTVILYCNCGNGFAFFALWCLIVLLLLVVCLCGLLVNVWFVCFIVC